MRIRMSIWLKAAIFVFLLAGGSFLAVAFYARPQAALAACSVPSGNYGTATAQVSVPSSGNYTIWTRMMPADGTNNSYMIEIDGGNCYTAGGASLPVNTWTWVDYKDGSDSSKIAQNLSAGTHTIKLIGIEPGVKVDRVLALADSCKPSGVGANCTNAVDAIKPVVSITTPVDGAVVSGNVKIAADATDNSGVSKVEFYVGDQLVATENSAPYEYNWNTTTYANIGYVIQAKAYDASGNSEIDSSNVTIKNGDSQPPTVPGGLRAEAPEFNRVVLSWSASTDNTGVAGYTVLRDGANLGTVAGTTFVDAKAGPFTAYYYQVVAFDAAGNRSDATQPVFLKTPSVPDSQAPSAPTNVNATAVSASQINVTWTSSSDNVVVAKYEVYRARGDGQFTKAGSTTATSFGDSALQSNTGYRYYVVAKDAANNTSAQSEWAEATTKSSEQPRPQEGSGDIRGKVIGRWGRAIAGAQVTVVVDGKKYRATTNYNGIYRIYNVPSGKHSLRVNAYGYNRLVTQASVGENRLSIINLRLNRR